RVLLPRTVGCRGRQPVGHPGRNGEVPHALRAAFVAFGTGGDGGDAVKCTRTVDAGAYVLGALAPTERAAYERHMAGCLDCRNEVAELAVLPGLLGRLDAATAVTLSTPPAQAPAGLLANTLSAATTRRRRYRRRQRWQLAVTGLAAACLAVLLGFSA